MKKIAQEMAAETYEVWATGSSDFYSGNKSQKDYVAKMWPSFVEPARATLLGLLITNIPDALKDEISDAIIKDHSIRFGNTNKIQIGDW